MRDPDAFYARRAGTPGRSVGFSETGRRWYRELKDFVYRHIIHSFPVSRHDGHARRVIAALFAAYRDNPRLLPDDVLAGLAPVLGVRYLREVALKDLEEEVAARYRTAAGVLPDDRGPHRRDDGQLLQRGVPGPRGGMRR